MAVIMPDGRGLIIAASSPMHDDEESLTREDWMQLQGLVYSARSDDVQNCKIDFLVP